MNVWSLFMNEVKIKATIEDIYNFYKEYPELMGMIEVETRYGYKKIEACDITKKNSLVHIIETESGKIIS